MRKFIALLAACVIAAHLTACTSSEEPGDGDEAVAEESSEADLPADGGDAVADSTDSGEPSDSVEAPPSDESTTTADAAPEGFLDEQLPEDSMGTADGEAPPPEIAAEPPADSSTPEGFSAPPPVSDTPSTDVATTEPAPDEPSTDTSFTGGTESSDTALSEPVAAPVAKPLLKAETTPFHRGGQLLNAIYVSRPGDSFKSMASMIYGDASRAKDIKAANAWVNNLVPGTKIYYNSPQRPTDDTKILTYYEDAGMAPEIYAAQPGENLKTVSKNLLGYDGAWKEVWALNSIDTKGDITEPTQLRYWKGGGAMTPPPVHQETAQATPPPMEEPMVTPPPAELPPPTEAPQDMAMNDMPPPPPTEEMAPPPPADLPPPPPPVEALNPPPPPPPVAQNAPEMMEGGESTNPFGLDNDTFMMLGGIGIVTLGLAALIIVRKRRQQRDMAAAFNDTQVG